MPKNVPFPIRTNCSGKLEIDSPLVMPIAMPLKRVIVAKVANIGVTFRIEMRTALITPHANPKEIPSRHAIRIHVFEIFPSSVMFCVIM